MKLMEGFKILEKQYPGYIILIKNGIFYNAIGKDAIILSQEFNLNKICFTKDKCKIGINENKIYEFTAELIKNNYKYIIFQYTKGDFKDIEEQFIEKTRRDEGRSTEAIQIEKDCTKCEYNKRIEKRSKMSIEPNRMWEIYHEAEQQAKGKSKSELGRIFQKKKQIEQDILYISKMTNDYLNAMIEEYLMEEED